MDSGKRLRFIIIGAVLVLLLVVWVITTYNTLVNRQEKVQLQWSEVQNTYQRRLDLIPNLVNVVKGVSDFEQSTLEEIAAARSNALTGLSNSELTAENYQKQSLSQDTLAAAANKMILLIEKYPTLKGTAAYTGLQTQLAGTERRIRVARNDFNKAVADYNRKVRSFPANLLAGLFGFGRKEGFTADTGSDKSVEIKF
ncbi:MAG: LemA family protein [Chitinophagaceae bacterium]|jgi:LemA protein|nr:LemA family protein [Chitinophagaceae bacterium]